MTTDSSTLADLRVAAKRTAVVWGGLFALGIGFGVLVVDQGLPWWLAPASAAMLLAGSVEFLSGVNGLDFILIAFFVALAIDAWRAHRDRTTLTAAVTGPLTLPEQMLLAWMTLFAVILVARHLVPGRAR